MRAQEADFAERRIRQNAINERLFESDLEDEAIPYRDTPAFDADWGGGAFKLAGKTLSFSIDLSGAGCGCNAAVYLVAMPQNPDATVCKDHCKRTGPQTPSDCVTHAHAHVLT